MKDHGSREAPSNRWPVNQLAANWLQKARDPADPERSALIQLAWWGLEKGGIVLQEAQSPSQPSPDQVEIALGERLVSGPVPAFQATRWLLTNPNLSQPEQTADLESKLEQAQSPQEAARAVLEAAYDRMAAASATFRE